MADFGERAGRYGGGGAPSGDAVQRAPGKCSLVEARYGVQRKARDVNKDPESASLPQPAAAQAGAEAAQQPAAAQAGAEAAPQPAASPGGQEATPKPGGQGVAVGDGNDTNAPPVAQYVIPFDRSPKSSPGEQILFGATYTHATPSDYKLVYTTAGGHFGSQGSNVTSKTVAGLSARNVGWFIDSAWDGRTAVTAKLELQKTDGTVVATTNWTFSKKAYQPTAIAQEDVETDRPNPSTYAYKVGPSRGTGADEYIGFTILEKFAGPYTTNLTLADLKPDYARTHGLAGDADIAPHFFPGTGDNGTFTVSAGDKIYDQHGGMSGADQAKAQLAAPKQIEKHLTQTYESDPGVVLGTYKIARVMKLDGSKAITKKKV